MPECTIAKKNAKKKAEKKKSDSLGKLGHRGALLFVSVLLHSLLALFPWREASRPPAVPISAIPIPVVSASQLPSLTAAEPQPLPAVPTVVPDPPAVASAPPAPTAALTPVTSAVEDSAVEEEIGPIEAPALEVTPIPDSTPATLSGNEDSGNEDSGNEEGDGEEAASNEGNSASEGNNGDEAVIAAAWENFTGYLQGQSGGFESMSLLDIFSLFGEPDQANQFFDENDRLKFEVSSYHLFPEQTPEGVVDTVITPEMSNQPDFELQPLRDFSSGLTYQISQGEDAFRYLTIVQLNERSGSVVIMSDSLPAL